MHDLTAWCLGAAMTFLALLGLVIASNAVESTMAYFGFGLTLFGVLFNYNLIARHNGKSQG